MAAVKKLPLLGKLSVASCPRVMSHGAALDLLAACPSLAEVQMSTSGPAGAAAPAVTLVGRACLPVAFDTPGEWYSGAWGRVG